MLTDYIRQRAMSNPESWIHQEIQFTSMEARNTQTSKNQACKDKHLDNNVPKIDRN